MGRNEVRPVLDLWGSKCCGIMQKDMQQQLARGSGAQERRKKEVRFGSYRLEVRGELEAGDCQPHPPMPESLVGVKHSLCRRASGLCGNCVEEAPEAVHQAGLISQSSPPPGGERTKERARV